MSVATRGRGSPTGRVLLAGGVLVALLVILHGVNGATVDGRFLSLDREANLPSWLRTLAFASAAVAAALASAGRAAGETRVVWRGLAALLLAFSLDDTVQGHEWLEQQTDASTLIRLVWPLAALLLLALFAMAWRRLDPLRRRLVGLAGTALVAAQGFAAVNDGLGRAVTVALSTLEQASEFAVAILVLAAACEPAGAALTDRARRRPSPTSGESTA